MGFGNFFKKLGQKLVPIGKTLYLGGKSVLHNVNRIGNKVMPITDIAIGMATPYLATNPYGQTALGVYAGLKGALALTNKLEQAIETGEQVAKEGKQIYQDVKQKGLEKGLESNYMNIIRTAKKGIDVGKDLKGIGQGGVELYRTRQGSSNDGGERIHESNAPLNRNAGDIGSSQAQNRRFSREMGDNTQAEQIRQAPNIQFLG
jgi:hypothetical protein